MEGGITVGIWPSAPPTTPPPTTDDARFVTLPTSRHAPTTVLLVAVVVAVVRDPVAPQHCGRIESTGSRSDESTWGSPPSQEPARRRGRRKEGREDVRKDPHRFNLLLPSTVPPPPPPFSIFPSSAPIFPFSVNVLFPVLRGGHPTEHIYFHGIHLMR